MAEGGKPSIIHFNVYVKEQNVTMNIEGSNIESLAYGQENKEAPIPKQLASGLATRQVSPPPQTGSNVGPEIATSQIDAATTAMELQRSSIQDQTKEGDQDARGQANLRNPRIVMFDDRSDWVHLYDPQTNSTTKTHEINDHMKNGRFQAVTVGQYIYVILSSRVMYRLKYSDQTSTWEKRSDIPPFHNYNSLPVVADNQMLLIGTMFIKGQTHVSQYDESGDEWMNVKGRQKATGSPAVIATNRFVYCFGGTLKGCDTDIVDRMDLDSFEWDQLPPMKKRLRAASAVEWKAKIYLLGGFVMQSKRNNSMDMYDIETNVWAEITRITIVSHIFKSYVIDGEVFVLDHKNEPFCVKVYNIDQDVWKEAITLPGMHISESTFLKSFP